MNLELRNVKINLAFSEETIMFKADLYVNGLKTANCHNDGHGGCTFYNRIFTQNVNVDNAADNRLMQAEEYCKGLPAQKNILDDGFGEYEIPMTLELFIDNMIDAEVIKKETEKWKKKIERLCVTKLLFTNVPEGNPIEEYLQVDWKNKPISEMLMSGKGILAIQQAIMTQHEKGFRLLNTNIPADKLPNLVTK